MSDETNRAVQAPTHAATAVIYGADASSMENQGSGEERGRQKISLACSLSSLALLKGHRTNKSTVALAKHRERLADGQTDK